MEELQNQFKYLVGAYYGVETMDYYDLKPYILKEIEDYIKNFVKMNPIEAYDYQQKALIYQEELSLTTKLQDSLLLLNKMNAPIDLILLIKNKLKELKEK